MRLLLLTILVVAAGVLPGQAKAETKHTPSIEEGLSLRTIDSPQISPDGRFVVYSQRETNWKDNEFVRQLWLVNVLTGKSIQLTRGKKSAGRADWSLDGRWLAFVTEREASAIEPRVPADKKEEKEGEKKEIEAEEKPAGQQIWLISPEGGEAWQLTKSGTDVGEFHWSKDSKLIAYSADAPESKARKDRR